MDLGAGMEGQAWALEGRKDVGLGESVDVEDGD